ncbi:hypothetical protein A0H81_00489 [Grifola frondosa]|uniref:Uncharacterized protein n=1 Tax=Grifola frondosa TaxID=5627 RepID=A0A1C7MSI5_GRIFR|nr:hypothetical protein A0H81_00489 [Grifola frondosa]
MSAIASLSRRVVEVERQGRYRGGGGEVTVDASLTTRSQSGNYITPLPFCCFYPLSWSTQVVSSAWPSRLLLLRAGPLPMSLLDHPERAAPYSRTSAPDAVGWQVRLLAGGRTVGHHLKNHVGVGIVCSVAYFDPGNWSVDLQAGSTFGYRPMLFVILMAGLGAIVLLDIYYSTSPT